MIQITPQMRVLVAVEDTDFRRGIDGLAQQCREALGADPFTGTMFVFRNRRRTSIKLLVYDGQGFWLCHKRLSQGKFRWWPSREDAASATMPGEASAKPNFQHTRSTHRTRSVTLRAHELQVLLCGGDPSGTRPAPVWRPVGASLD